MIQPIHDKQDADAFALPSLPPRNTRTRKGNQIRQAILDEHLILRTVGKMLRCWLEILAVTIRSTLTYATRSMGGSKGFSRSRCTLRSRRAHLAVLVLPDERFTVHMGHQELTTDQGEVNLDKLYCTVFFKLYCTTLYYLNCNVLLFKLYCTV